MTAAPPERADAIARGMLRARRAKIRDTQDSSMFAQILDDLVRISPGALGAALVDAGGETVDYAGYLDPFDLKVAAAHWQIVLTEFAEAPHLGDVQQIVVHARARSYVVRRMPSSYAVVVILHRHAAFAVSERAMCDADARLSREAGWPVRRDPVWCNVEVETVVEAAPSRPRPGDERVASASSTWLDPSRSRAPESAPSDRPSQGARERSPRRPARERLRPARVRIGGAWQVIDVMGCLVGLRTGERGYRVRLPSGVEMTLVRERHGRWFCDERMD